MSRDAFGPREEERFEVVAYFARSGIATFDSPAEVDEEILGRIGSPFQRRMVRFDMSKAIPDELVAMDFDVLLVDFIDERFDLARFASGHLRTLSSEYRAVDEAEGREIVRSGSEEHFSLWRNGWLRLTGGLRRQGLMERVRVNRVFWAEEDASGKRFPWSDAIRSANGHLARMYAFVEGSTPDAGWIRYPTALFVADPGHRWGLSPFHYRQEVYDHMIQRIEAGEGGTVDVSLVIPCHDAVGKIGRCLASLRRIDLAQRAYEVVFVDDGSSDGTFELLRAQCAGEANWQVIRLEANSGSPSEPRNRGVREARGDYVFFLDCDDEILPDTLRVHLDYARERDADVVRGYLVSEAGGRRTEANRIWDWSPSLSKKERIERIIGQQSTVPCSLVRRSLLMDNGISWRSDLRMGEDTLFLAEVLTVAERIEYIEHPTYVYVKTQSFTPSSTQTYGNRELRDHLTVWRSAIVALQPLGIDYATLRLRIGLQTALRSMIFLNRGEIAPETFQDFSAFLREHRAVIAELDLAPRLKELVAIAEAGAFEAFRRACRPRLLIAGYDLKFITGIIPQLDECYDIRLDTWEGHDQHDAAASRRALDWAEIIWCEWLLGNAVWYSRNKKRHQVLIVRMHRFELGRDFGARLAVANVHAVVAVSTLFLERLLERFPNIPRPKARLQHNYIDVPSYTVARGDDRIFRLAMIGIVPSRKGFDRALSILSELRARDRRYTLDVFGDSPGDLAWLSRQPDEIAYYSRCEAIVEAGGLSDAVRYRGYSDIRRALGEQGIGIVLSLSDSVREFPGSESFHLAVADGFATGGVGLVRHWEGAEYVWPGRFILASDAEIVDRILSYREDPGVYRADAAAGLDFVSRNYGVQKFVTTFRSLFQEAF